MHFPLGLCRSRCKTGIKMLGPAIQPKSKGEDIFNSHDGGTSHQGRSQAWAWGLPPPPNKNIAPQTKWSPLALLGLGLCLLLDLIFFSLWKILADTSAEIKPPQTKNPGYVPASHNHYTSYAIVNQDCHRSKSQMYVSVLLNVNECLFLNPNRHNKAKISTDHSIHSFFHSLIQSANLWLQT